MCQYKDAFADRYLQHLENRSENILWGLELEPSVQKYLEDYLENTLGSLEPSVRGCVITGQRAMGFGFCAKIYNGCVNHYNFNIFKTYFSCRPGFRDCMEEEIMYCDDCGPVPCDVKWEIENRKRTIRILRESLRESDWFCPCSFLSWF